jgi:multicomponent Na+:H+ antiporter subunit G
MMGAILGTVLMMVGVVLIVIAGIGLLRMPDLYLRMSAVTKAATLGLGLILLGTAVYFADLGVASRALATAVFVLLTAPVSAHMMGRAAYSNGAPLWEGTVLDELNGRYDDETQTLAGVEMPIDEAA